MVGGLLLLASLGPVVAGSAQISSGIALSAVRAGKGGSHLSASLQQLVPGARASSIASGMPSSLIKRDQGGRVGVRITAQDPDALLPDLRALGMTITASLPDHHLLEGYIAISQLSALDALAAKGLFGVLPMSPSKRNVGAATSQADFTQGVDRVRATVPPGLTGAGVGIGVMSDSFNRLGGAAAGVTSGDLPTVTVLQDAASGGTDEGRAMAELVHDLAPGSPIKFGSVDFGEVAFAQTIQNLANPAVGNCKALVDDVFYYAEPIYQDGVIAQAVDSVVANRGVTYFSSAGNQADEACEFINPQVSGDGYLDFNNSVSVDNTQRIVIPAHGTVQLGLHWDDPYYTDNGVDTDLDLGLYSYNSNSQLILVASSAEDSIQNRTPWEFLQYTNPLGVALTCEIAIQRYGTGPNPLRVRWENYGDTVNVVEYAERRCGTISPHSAAESAMSVAAVNYFEQGTPAWFTSVGPANIIFAPNGTRLSNVVTRNKPDIASIQGTDTTFFGQDADGNGFPNFFGTSAAAPHAAAIAALVKQQFPSMTPAEIYARLEGSTGNSTWNNVTGFGTVRAYEAIFGASTPANVAFSDGFESNTLSGAYEVWSTGAGRVQVTNSLTPATGTRHLLLDSALGSTNSRNGVILHVNAAGLSNVTLSFKEKEFSDDDHPMSSTFTSENSDGVALSVDGITWYRLVSLTGAASTANYQTQTFNLNQIAANNGLTLGANTRILFQQYGNSVASADGLAFDDLAITASGGVPITVTAPNGGESWAAGSSQAITWSTFGLSGNVKLEYSTNGGSTWTTIAASTVNDGTESWTVPNAATTQGRVRVSSVADGGVNDASDSNFTLTGAPVATLTVTAPNGGESWTVGTTQTIAWSSANLSANVKLEYYNGSIWTVINASTANDGTESWTVPNAPSTQARVRVTSVTDGGISDTSDADFTIRYVGGVLKAPKKAAFGKVKIGKTKTVNVVLQNTSKTAALVVNVSISGAPFRIVSGGGTSTIAAKKKLTVKVICEPTAAAPDGTLTVTSSDPAKPSVSIPLDVTIK
jgi:hypothetical protein